MAEQLLKKKAAEPQRGLMLGFGALLVLMVALATISLYHMGAQQARLDRVVHTHMAKAEWASQMRQSARERTLILHRLLFIDDPFARDEELLYFGVLAGRFGRARAALLGMELSSQERAMMERQRVLTKLAVPMQERIVELSEQGDRERAMRLLVDEAVSAQDNVLAVVDGFDELQREAARHAAQEAADLQQKTRTLILVLSGLAVLIGVAVSGVVVRNVRKASAKHAYLATHDALTGLPNRVLLLDRLEHEIARSKRQLDLTGVMFIDLDHFKDVNDRLGHAAGDHLLTQVVARMSHGLRATDTLARLSGDEFVLILADARFSHDIEATADKLVDSISQPFVIDGQQVSVGASVGVAVYPHHGESAEALLHNADLAMYAAKERGRNCWHLYDRIVEQGP